MHNTRLTYSRVFTWETEVARRSVVGEKGTRPPRRVVEEEQLVLTLAPAGFLLVLRVAARRPRCRDLRAGGVGRGRRRRRRGGRAGLSMVVENRRDGAGAIRAAAGRGAKAPAPAQDSATTTRAKHFGIAPTRLEGINLPSLQPGSKTFDLSDPRTRPRGLTAGMPGSMRRLCGLYAGGMRALCGWYAGGMRVVCACYAGGMRVVCEWYAGGMRVVCGWYVPAMPVVCACYAGGMRLLCRWYAAAMLVVCVVRQGPRRAAVAPRSGHGHDTSVPS